jgi:hypothetical protein
MVLVIVSFLRIVLILGSSITHIWLVGDLGNLERAQLRRTTAADCRKAPYGFCCHDGIRLIRTEILRDQQRSQMFCCCCYRRQKAPPQLIAFRQRAGLCRLTVELVVRTYQLHMYVERYWPRERQLTTISIVLHGHFAYKSQLQ